MPQPLVQSIVANLLIFFQAIALNYIVVNHRLMRDNTLLPAVAYVLFVSLLPQFAVFSFVLLANTCILLALTHILSASRISFATTEVFNAGFFLALASVFYFPYVIFSIWGVISLVQLRKFRFLEFIQYLTGICTPVILYVTYRYWNGQAMIDMPMLLGQLGNRLQGIPSLLTLSMSGMYVLFTSVVLVVLFYTTIAGRKNIQIQKKYNVQYWFLLFTLPAFLLFKSQGLEHLLVLSVPLAFLGGVFASDSSSRLTFEFIHLILIACALFAGFS